MSKLHKMISLPFIAIAVLAVDAWAQAPDTLWTRMYNYTTPMAGYSIRQTADGGFIIGGYDHNHIGGYESAYLLRTNSTGDSLWASSIYAAYGAAYTCVAISPTNNIFGVGWIHGLSGGQQGWGAIYSDTGSWQRFLYFGAGGVQQNSITWIDNAPDSCLIAVDNPGDNGNPVRTDLRLTMLSDSGDVVWSKSFGGPNDEVAGAVRTDVQGGYIIAGSTSSYGGGDFDGYLVRTDSLGDTLWTKTYGGIAADNFRELVQAPDGGYIIIGTTSSSGAGGTDIWVVRTNSIGDTIWTKTYGTPQSDKGYSIDSVPSGGYILSGIYNDNGILIRINEVGDTLWTKVMNPGSSSAPLSVIALPDREFAFTGYVSLNEGQDLWIVRLGPEAVGIDEDEFPLPRNFSLEQNYPNPFNASTTLSYSISETGPLNLSIYNILGRKVAILFEGQQAAGENRVIWDAAGFPSGIYFAKMEAGGKSETIKMVLLK